MNLGIYENIFCHQRLFSTTVKFIILKKETGVDADSMFCINIYEQFSAKTQMSALTNVLQFLQKLTLCHSPGENTFRQVNNIFFVAFCLLVGWLHSKSQMINFGFAVAQYEMFLTIRMYSKTYHS